MNEYISREAVINITAETGAWETQNRIRELPAADVQPVNQWISIDERLPQDGEEALVYAGNRGVMIGLYDSVLQVWLDYECCGLKVTHWQPLPEPPRRRAENDT